MSYGKAPPKTSATRETPYQRNTKPAAVKDTPAAKPRADSTASGKIRHNESDKYERKTKRSKDADEDRSPARSPKRSPERSKHSKKGGNKSDSEDENQYDHDTPTERRPQHPRNGAFFQYSDLTVDDIREHHERLTFSSGVIHKDGRNRIQTSLDDDVSTSKLVQLEVRAYSEYGLKIDTKNDKKEGRKSKITDKKVKLNIQCSESENKDFAEMSDIITETYQKRVDEAFAKGVFKSIQGDAESCEVKKILRLPDTTTEKSVSKFINNVNPNFTSFGVLYPPKRGTDAYTRVPTSWNDFSGKNRPVKHKNYLGRAGEYFMVCRLSHYDIKKTGKTLYFSPIMYILQLDYIIPEKPAEIVCRSLKVKTSFKPAVEQQEQEQEQEPEQEQEQDEQMEKPNSDDQEKETNKSSEEGDAAQD